MVAWLDIPILDSGQWVLQESYLVPLLHLECCGWGEHSLDTGRQEIYPHLK